MTDKQLITEQIVKVQNELERLTKLLQDEPEETVAPESPAFNCLEVTEVQVFPSKEELGTVKALARIVLNDQLVIRGLRVMDGLNGLFVNYPCDPFDECRWVCNPITRQLREHIENCVLEKYLAAIA